MYCVLRIRYVWQIHLMAIYFWLDLHLFKNIYRNRFICTGSYYKIKEMLVEVGVSKNKQWERQKICGLRLGGSIDNLHLRFCLFIYILSFNILFLTYLINFFEYFLNICITEIYSRYYLAIEVDNSLIILTFYLIFLLNIVNVSSSKATTPITLLFSYPPSYRYLCIRFNISTLSHISLLFLKFV